MKASVESTTEVVTIRDIEGNTCKARVWAGLSEAGVRFTAEEQKGFYGRAA